MQGGTIYPKLGGSITRNRAVKLIQFLARPVKTDRVAIDSRLAQRPLNVDAVGFRALHCRLAKRRSGAGLQPLSKGFGAHIAVAYAESPPVLGSSERGF